MTSHHDGWPLVTAVVVAAGLSRRMGDQNKLLLPYRGLPMIRQAVLQALASQVSDVVAVLGHDAESVRQALAGLPVRLVYNDAFDEGLGASVRAGAQSVADGHAALVCLGDMPKVTAAVLDQLILAYQGIRVQDANRPVILQAGFQGKRGNPVLWSPGFLSNLRALHGDEGARRLIQDYAGYHVCVETGEPGVLIDVDTPHDLPGMNMSLGNTA